MPASVVGRGTESQVATQFLDGLRGGSGVLLLSGEPGIGKTSLWTAVVEQAHRFPCRVLTARPVRAEIKLAFAALSDLLADVGDDIFDRLPEPQRRALAVALLREDPGGRRHDQRIISAATLSVLTALSGAPSWWQSTTCSGSTVLRLGSSSSRCGDWLINQLV